MRSAVAAGLVLVSLAGAGSATADKASAPAAKSGKAAASDHDYLDTCAKGNAKFVAHDVPGAMELYQRAIQTQPANPFAHYLVGEAQLASGNLPEAEKAFLEAQQVSEHGTPQIRAKIIFVLAALHELQKPEEGKPPIEQKKWEDSKTAWQQYADFAEKHADATVYPGSAASRQQMIADMHKQDQAYVVVRQRIKEEGANPPKK